MQERCNDHTLQYELALPAKGAPVLETSGCGHEKRAKKSRRLLTPAQQEAQRKRNKISKLFLADAAKVLPGGFLQTASRCVMHPRRMQYLDVLYNTPRNEDYVKRDEVTMALRTTMKLGPQDVANGYRDGFVASQQWSQHEFERWAATINLNRGFLNGTQVTCRSSSSSRRSANRRVPLTSYKVTGALERAVGKIFDEMERFAAEREHISSIQMEYQHIQDGLRKVVRCARGLPSAYPANLNKLNVKELERELGERSLNSKGTKQILVERLEQRLVAENVVRMLQVPPIGTRLGQSIDSTGSDVHSLLQELEDRWNTNTADIDKHQASSQHTLRGEVCLALKANLGRYTRHTPEILLAFAMGTHDRLGASTQQGVGVGKKCPYLDMDAVLVRQIAEMCEWDPHYTIFRVRSRVEYLKREYSNAPTSPLTDLLPPFSQNVLKLKDSGLAGRGYPNTLEGWQDEPENNRKIQEYNVLSLDRELLQAGAARHIGGLADMMTGVEAIRFDENEREEVDLVVPHIQVHLRLK